MRKSVICVIIFNIFLRASSFPNLNIVQPNHQNNIFAYNIQIDGKTYHKATGYVRDVKGENIIAQEGMYEIHFPDDKVLKIYYVADENGYVVKNKKLFTVMASENLVSEGVKTAPIPSKIKQPVSNLISTLRIVSPTASPGPSTSSQSTLASTTSLSALLTTSGNTTEPILIDTREPIIDNKAIGSLVG